MAKIEMIEQSSKNLTVRMDSCREDVTLLMDYAKEVLERLIRARFKYQQVGAQIHVYHIFSWHLCYYCIKLRLVLVL